MHTHTAVVTGGGSGIGRAIALRLAKTYKRIAVMDIDPAAAQATAALVADAGGRAEPIACDVGSESSIQEAFAQLDRVDALVNNAGIASIGTVEQCTPQELDRVYAVNVRGVYLCTRAAVPAMLAQGGGVIVNLASIASKIGLADRFAYSMSKGAVLAMTLSVARDYVGKGIRCNCVCPARVHTPFVDGYLEKHYPPEERPGMFEKLAAYQPIGRMGQPDEIAALVAFLAGPDAAFITGAAYDIDGGVINLR